MSRQPNIAFSPEPALPDFSPFLRRPTPTDIGIERMLAFTGRLLGIDLIYLFRASEDGLTMSATHEWVAPGLTAQKHNLQGMKRSRFSWWVERLERDGVINIPDLAGVPEPERSTLEGRGFAAALALPLRLGGEVAGFLAFNQNTPREWKEEEAAIAAAMLESIEEALEGSVERTSTGKARPATPGLPQIEVDEDPGRIIHLNRAVAAKLGFGTEELAGQSFLDVPFSEFKQRADAAPFPVNLVDNTLTYTYANPVLAKLFGYDDPAEVIGNSALFNITMEGATPEEMLASAFNTGTTSEKAIMRPNGEIRELIGQYYAVRDREGLILEFVGFDEDQTLRKQREELFQSLSEFTYDWLLWLTPEGDVIYASPSAERITGYGKEAWENGSVRLSRLVEPEDAPVLRLGLDAALQSQEMGTVEFRMRKKNGDLRWLEMAYIPVYGKTGDFLGSRASLRDITENKDLQEKLVRAERLAVLGELAGSVSHELRNPLNVVKSSTFYLRGRLGKGDEKVARHLDRIERSVERADRTISDLLAFSRLKPTRLQRTRLDALAQRVVADTALPPEVSVTVWAEDDLPEIMVDQVQMEQVLRNLILNSAQAMEKRGQIRVELSTRGDTMVITVQDDGCGIPPENLPKVYDPLFTTKTEGTGFGLAVCKRVVEEHDGTIDIESEPAKGTRATIRLPRHREE